MSLRPAPAPLDDVPPAPRSPSTSTAPTWPSSATATTSSRSTTSARTPRSPLSEGDVEDCEIECWLHGSRFDLRTGKPTGLPATEPVAVYPVTVEGDDVLVDVTPRSTTPRHDFKKES